MLWLPLLAALSQTPDVRAPVAVVVTSRRKGAEVVAGKVAGRVYDVLAREGVAPLLGEAAAVKELRVSGFGNPNTCQGTRACVGKLALLLGPRAVVVGVDVGKVGNTLAIHLDAIAADDAKPVASLDVSSSFSGWDEAMSAPIVVFAREVKAALGPTKPVASPQAGVALPADAPKQATLTPQAPPTVVAEAPAPKSRAVPWALTGAAVAAAGAAVTLGVLGGNDKSKYEAALVTLPDGSLGSTLPEAEARSLASGANTKIGLAVGSAVVSAALGGLATYFFLSD